MPSLQNLTVNDRATTPVAHTFTPRSLKEGVAKVVEGTGVPIGEASFTISLRQAGPKYKGRLVLAKPTVVNETINGVTVPTVARTAYAALDLTFDQTSTLQERKDLIGMFADALSASKVLVNDTFTNLEGIY